MGSSPTGPSRLVNSVKLWYYFFMSERGPSFGGGFERQEATPERSLIDGMRQAAFEILGNPEDALSREIAEKLLFKATVKEQVDDMLAYADDSSVYQGLKKLGTLVVREAEAQFDYDDPDSGFSIQRGDSYLDVHIPPVPREQRSRDTVYASLALVREYIIAHSLQPKYVMGVTYQRLGEVAHQVFGFNIAYPNPTLLPSSVIAGVQRVYEQFTEDGLSGRDMGLPVIVFKDTAEFLDAESPQPSTLHNRLGGMALGEPDN